MRRYHVEVAGKTHVIDVNELTAHDFQVTVGGQQFTVTLSSAEDVSETVIAPDMGARADRDRNGDDPEPEAPSAARFRPAPPDALRSMVPAAPPKQPPPVPDRAAAIGAIKAPMPGTVTSVDVAPGDEVKNGQVLLKLEAMKMVNAIKSPRGGVVAEVPVQPGQSVGYGHLLVVFKEN